MREIIAGTGDKFPYKALNQKMAIEPTFNDLQIENLLSTKYSTRYSYLILSLLYPGRDWKDKRYDEDHIFPCSEFSKSNLKKRDYSEDKINNYRTVFDSICNLELLDESENRSKNATPFDMWIKSRDANFKERHHIPEIKSYSFDDFMEFADRRKAILEAKLREFKFEDSETDLE